MLKVSTEHLPQVVPNASIDTDICITLHTRISQSLFNGSWKHGKMGLLQFSKVILLLWRAAKNDDPYAEWYLLKTYQALTDTRKKIKDIEKNLDELLGSIRGVEIHSFMKTQPVKRPLSFATPYGFMGAYLITDIDHVIRQLLTLEKMGITLASEDISIKQLVSWVQDVFAIPRLWHHSGITRQDIFQNSPKAQVIKSQLGEIPETVLHKRISFTFLPKTNKEVLDD